MATQKKKLTPEQLARLKQKAGKKTAKLYGLKLYQTERQYLPNTREGTR